MSDFINILDNHRELLYERGYDEIGLGSPDKPGLFMRRLERLFSDCLQKSLFDDSRKDFFIDAVGFFNNDVDLVLFNFHYEVDPAKGELELKSFIARMDGIKLPFLLNRNMYELPQATRVHKLLCEERQRLVARKIIKTENNQQNSRRLKK